MTGCVKIGSFNLYKFSYQSDKDIRKDLSKIAQAIRDGGFDILAMQEVFHLAAIDRLMAYLGPGWTSAWASPPSRSAQAAEGYAFLWRTDKFRLATGKTGENDVSPSADKRFAPHIYQQYSRDPILANGRLARDPFYIRLESLHGWYELRLIDTHILFSDTRDQGDGTRPPLLDAEKRRREFEALVNIYCRISDKRYRSCRPSYTFLLGDYNLNLRRSGALSGPYLSRGADEDIEKWENGRLLKRIVTRQEALTTLKARSSREPDRPAQGFANNYDHFTYDELYFADKGGVVSRCGVIDTVDMLYHDRPDRYDLHRREISDHIPVYLLFSLA